MPLEKLATLHNLASYTWFLEETYSLATYSQLIWEPNACKGLAISMQFFAYIHGTAWPWFTLNSFNSFRHSIH